jgi:hypothetical protein
LAIGATADDRRRIIFQVFFGVFIEDDVVKNAEARLGNFISVVGASFRLKQCDAGGLMPIEVQRLWHLMIEGRKLGGSLKQSS